MRGIFKSPAATLAVIAVLLMTIVLLITIFWDSIAASVFPNTTLGLYNRTFWEGFLVELHGIVFELTIIGVLIVWLDSRRNKSGHISRLKEDLQDYSTLDSPETNVKKLGHIKRLNEHNVKEIDVLNLVLNDMIINRVSIERSRLIGLEAVNSSIVNSEFKSMRMRSSNFTGGTIKSTRFDNCDLLKSKFVKATCRGVDFTNSSLERAEFTNADLQSSNFSGCDVRETLFDGANLKHASFRNAKHLTPEILSKAKNLDYVKVDDATLDKLKILRPDMNYQRKRGSA